jgi:hypothetical protein
MEDCFVVMPIGSGDAYQVHLNRYEHIIHPAVEGYRRDGEQIFKCIRADFVTKSGSITKDLIGRLYRSRVVIADLTDLNPNVFYELGVRHALRSGTILVSLRGTKPPFDVGDLRIVSYEDRVGGEKEAIPQIQAMLTTVLEETRLQDSPVLQAIPELAELGPQKEHEARYAALMQERDLLRAQLDVLERTTLTNQATLSAMSEAVTQLQSHLGPKKAQESQAAVSSLVQARSHSAATSRPLRKTNVRADPGRVFVLMPFAAELEPVYAAIVAAANETNLRVMRADTILESGSIIDQIYEAIAGAGLIVADVTGGNQNVMYELGLANAMSKKTLLLSQSFEQLPFDIAQQRVIKYQPSIRGIEELSKRLIEFLRAYSASADA